jgi:hypothetical protein
MRAEYELFSLELTVETLDQWFDRAVVQAQAEIAYTPIQ